MSGINSASIKKVLKNNTMIFVLMAVMVLFEVLIRLKSDGDNSLFLPENFTNLINQNAYVVILATGMLMCILTGGNIDLSVGSVVCLVGGIAGILIKNMNAPVGVSILICILAGIAIGAWHGLWIAFVHIPPFIVTLSGMLLWRGIASSALRGMTISNFPPKYMNLFSSYIFRPETGTMSVITFAIALVCCAAFTAAEVFSRINKVRKGYKVSGIVPFIAKLLVLSAVILAAGYLLSRDKGIPVVLIIVAVIVAAYSYYTQNTVSGRYLYAIGGNEKAARLSGVNTDHVMFFAYTNMGFLAAVAALVCVARFDSAAPSAGQNYEMDAIASCFIGGASAYGGTGTVGGAVIGAVFMGVLNNGMSMLSVDANWQRAVKGLVLLLAVIFDVVSKKKKAGKGLKLFGKKKAIAK